MTSITLNVTGARIEAAVNGPLTSGMVGIPVTIRYDDAWNGLTKNFVCRCGKWGHDKGETRTVLNIGEAATVAHEVMQADMHLYLGIEGYSTDGKLVIPTTWADCGMILHGANSGEDLSTDPKLSVWAQLQAEIEKIKQDPVTEGTIAAAVAAYLEENPIEGSDSSQNANAGSVYQNYSKYKAVFLGDSQTAATSAKTKIWWEWVKELLNIGESVNYGLSGSALCGTGSTSMCTRYANMDADASMVFVMGGVNDFKTSVSTPIGTIGDTTPDTMYGAVRYLCQKLRAKYPKTPIIFITPTNQTNAAFVHSGGLTMADLAWAMREACRLEGILCLDAQASLGINPAYDQSYTTDRLHLNDDGQELLGKWVANQVNAHVPIPAAMTTGSSGENGGDEHTHSYTSTVTTAATCTTAGARTYTCSCGDSYTEAIPATGHNYVDGICTVCGAADPTYSPDVTLVGISVTYTGGEVPEGTALTDLPGIVVTAHYSDSSNETVTGYTLSGAIVEGSNTITVSYGGKTTTFTVTGVAESVEIPTEHNGWEVTKIAELPTDISTIYQYTGFINNKGTYTENTIYSHSGYIACEAGTYSIVPYIGVPVSVYDATFNWIETKSISTQGVAFDLVLSEFRYVILATQNSKGYTTISKTV